MKTARKVMASYENFKESRLLNIRKYAGRNNVSKWDDILLEYVFLQDAYDAITSYPLLVQLFVPKDFRSEMKNAVANAARDYYNIAAFYIMQKGRNYALNAYTYFKKAGLLAPELKDGIAKADSIFKTSAIIVVVNPFQGNQFYLKPDLNSPQTSFTNAVLADYLKRSDNKKIPAKYLTAEEAARQNFSADYIIDVTLLDMTPNPSPAITTNTSTTTISIVVGVNQDGKNIIQVANAGITQKISSYTASARVEIKLTDLHSQGAAVPNNLSAMDSWQTTTQTFSGDFRALGYIPQTPIPYTADPTDVKRTLVRKLYPEMVLHINTSLLWASRSVMAL